LAAREGVSQKSRNQKEGVKKSPVQNFRPNVNSGTVCGNSVTGQGK
jgi:hypothetical protein